MVILALKTPYIMNYRALGRLPGVADKIVDMAMNASGIRDTVRVLNISPTTVLNKLKQQGREPAELGQYSLFGGT